MITSRVFLIELKRDAGVLARRNAEDREPGYLPGFPDFMNSNISEKV